MPIHGRRLFQEMLDTYRRALTGGPFYAAAWLLVAVYGKAFTHAPMASWSILLAFIALATWRFVHRPLADGADAASLRRWLRLHWGIVFITTALWGGLFFWATFDPAFGAARITALLFTLGLATAIAHAFSMRRGFAFGSIALLVLPGMALLWIVPADRANGLMFAIYMVYVVISLLRAHVEYQQRLDLDQELRNQRDLFSTQSRIDPLTELANRRQFSDVLDAATHCAMRNQKPLSLVLLDLDHFKHINDSHGHSAGDACLVAVAQRLRASFEGPGELAARVGGEEFAIVLDGHDAVESVNRAEQFRASLAAQPVMLGGLALTLTASIGVAGFDPALHADVDALYHASDSAVYRAKASGRNRVCVHESEAIALTAHDGDTDSAALEIDRPAESPVSTEAAR